MASYGKKVGKVYGSIGSNKGRFGATAGVKIGKNDYQVGLTGNVKKPGLGVYAGRNVESNRPKVASVAVGSTKKDPAYKKVKSFRGRGLGKGR